MAPCSASTFNDILHPWRNQYMPGVRQWFQNASMFRFVPLAGRVAIGGDGIPVSACGTQWGLRLTW
jgi:hypothetical protein